MKTSSIINSLLCSYEFIFFLLILFVPAAHYIFHPHLGNTPIHGICVSIVSINNYERGILAIISIFLAGIWRSWNRMSSISFPKHEISDKKMVRWSLFDDFKATYLTGVIWSLIFTLTLLFSLDIGSPIQSCSFLILSSTGYAVAFVTNYLAVEKVEETYHKYSDSSENANKL